jgi:uncharacterized membrane protein
MIAGIISAALSVISEGLKLANTHASREHINKRTQILLKLKELEEKPYLEQDDAEIVSTYKEAKIWIEQAADIMKMPASSA